MKKITSFLVATLILTVLGTAVVTAEEQTDKRRAAFEEGFDKLLQNSRNDLGKPAVKETLAKSGETFEKFAISSVAVSTSTDGTTTACNLGVKVWFTLENGTCFNPVKRKMGVKEKFYVHLQSAVPVCVSLFQNYPESRPESKQVYPDKQYADSFKVIQAGVATRLPVVFEMDDDTRDEIMAMVVVRADAPNIQSSLSTQATSSVSTNNGVTTVTAQASASTAGTMKGLNDRVAKGEDAETKFSIAGPAATAPAASTVPNDVAFFMLGAGYAGQWQLTLKK